MTVVTDFPDFSVSSSGRPTGSYPVPPSLSVPYPSLYSTSNSVCRSLPPPSTTGEGRLN